MLKKKKKIIPSSQIPSNSGMKNIQRSVTIVVGSSMTRMSVT